MHTIFVSFKIWGYLFIAISLLTVQGLFASTVSAQTVAGFYVSPSGSDWNPGTLSAPFATLARAQIAMRGSNIKTTYVRAGTYYPLSVLQLNEQDSGQTWTYYPPDGIGSAIIDGGSNSPTTGLEVGFNIIGSSNVTVNGLRLRNFRRELLHAGADWGPVTRNITFTNNILHDNYAIGGAAIAAFGSVQNSVITNNYIYNTATFGISLSPCGATCANEGINGSVVKNNFLYNTCRLDEDCGAIYVYDWGTPRSSNFVIENNFIRDVTLSNDIGGRGIYLDDGASNAIVRGNIVSGKKVTCFNIHGGQNNTFSGNICDLQSSGNQHIAIYQTTIPAWTIPMTGNSFVGNIIIAGSSLAGKGYWADAVNFKPVIRDNIYHNYVGSRVNSSGTASVGSDTNPINVNPQLSTWCYNLAAGSPAFNSPVNFPRISGGWGPAGFVMPLIGTAPSMPNSASCESTTQDPVAPTPTPTPTTTPDGISPDGSTITPGSGSTLITIDGKWTFGPRIVNGGTEILLDGVQRADGAGVKMVVANGGKLYHENQWGTWYVWSNGWWSNAADPTGSVAEPPVTPTVDTQAPSVPTGLSASVVSSTQIDLAWTASTDNVGVSGYRIFSNGTQIATSNTTSFIHSSLLPDTTYRYTVSAFDLAQNTSAQSVAVSATTLPAAVSPQTSVERGDRVRTVTTTDVHRKPSLRARAIGTQPAGVLGTVTRGPSRDGASEWWQVNFDSGANGWVLVQTITTQLAEITPSRTVVSNSSTPSSMVVPANAPPMVITQMLTPGTQHPSVQVLQRILNKDQATMVAPFGVGSPGFETDYFGPMTTKAVQEFQKKWGIVASGSPETSGFGTVGPRTLQKLGEVSVN